MITGDFAECIEKTNSSYTKGFAQVRKNSSHTLVGCCPKGEECGETCEKNSKCYVSNHGENLPILPYLGINEGVF